MVQTSAEPDLYETLRHASRSGAGLPLEVLAALEHSLPLKRATARLRSLAVWGRITTRSGRDYIVAEGDADVARVYGTAVTYSPKYFFTQDGANWVDLPPLLDDDKSGDGDGGDGGGGGEVGEAAKASAVPTVSAAARRALKIRGILTGDPAHQWDHASASTPAAAADSAGADSTDGEAPGGRAAPAPVPELHRLRAIVDAISSHASLEPDGCRVADARGRLVASRLFGGVEHPLKLESYRRRGDALAPGATLARDVRGCWSIREAGAVVGGGVGGGGGGCGGGGGGGGGGAGAVAEVRSLVYPGYSFFYDARRLTWGGFYCGDGARNGDLVFML